MTRQNGCLTAIGFRPNEHRNARPEKLRLPINRRHAAFSTVLGTVLSLGALAGSAQTTVPTGRLKLEDGTPVKLRLQRTISSADASVDERIDFDVLDEVKINGTVVIPKGSIAWGTVTAAQPKRRMARGGKLDINIDSVRLTDGEKAPLRMVRKMSGGGHTGAMTGAMVATSLFVWPAAPFFLFMHGKDVTVPKGTEITAYVNGDMEIAFAGAEPIYRPSSQPAAGSLAASFSTHGTIAPIDPTVAIQSNPDGGDITIDGKFVGNTPSTVQLTPGEHSVVIQRLGFKAWQRSLSIAAGSNVSLSAVLEKN